MKQLFKEAYENAKAQGDTPSRIAQLHLINLKDEHDIKDFTQFGLLMSRKSFEAKHPQLSHLLRKNCKDVMVYVSGYFIQGLEGGNFFNNNFSATGKTSKDIVQVEKYLFKKLQKLSKESLHIV
tara:strand:+ start:667 stop:1038 length:372 start_codon:yes stop_codon:yes gene_type:complete